MGTEVVVNKKWSLTGRQWLMGLIQAVIPPVLLKVAEIASSGSLSFDWQALLAIGIASAAPYIIRKLGEDSVVTVEKVTDNGHLPHPPRGPKG